MSLFNKLEDLNNSDMLPMHMPGHKRNSSSDPCLEALGAKYDITEISGFDDLHDPAGCIRDIERKAESLWKTKRSHILTCGSTCGILASLYAVLGWGCKLIMARNCHRSVYHAVEICNADPVYVNSGVDENSGISLPVSVDEIKKAIAESPDATAIIITSPTYEGVISDVAEIADQAHAAGMILIVDEAHGAHLGFGGFPAGATSQGADVVVQSLHKTLAGLTQTAVLHICSDRVDDRTISHALDIFETSSPSYILMASIDNCLNKIVSGCTDRWCKSCYAIAEKLTALKNLTALSEMSTQCSNGFDVSKLTLLTNGRITGFELADILRNEHNIEIEMAAPGYIVAMTGMGDTDISLGRFVKAILNIDSSEQYFSNEPAVSCTFPRLPEKVMTAAEALASNSETVSAEKCRKRISREYVTAYPPGIPLVVPGEVLDGEMLEYISWAKSLGANIKSYTGNAPCEYQVVDGIFLPVLDK